MIQQYIQIIQEYAKELYGDNTFIIPESDSDDTRLHIKSTLWDGYHLFTFFMEDGHFIFNLPFFYDPKNKNYHRSPVELKCQNLEVFKQTLEPIFNLIITPHIIQAYKQGCLNDLPPSLQSEKRNIDLSKLTPEVFEQLFHEATEEESNGETLEQLEITQSQNTVTFDFRVDCGRQGIHKDNKVIVNNRGIIQIDLAEVIEGGGIKDSLEEKILNLITI
jgi:hypothetical protein